jgi:hypothetical protein
MPMMTAHAPLPPDAAVLADQRARLRSALTLVEQMAGESTAPSPIVEDEEAAAQAYAAATSVARRRFDALASEAGVFAAAGIAALLRHHEAKGKDCAPAAAQLAQDMRRALTAMDRLIPPA